MAAQAYGTAAPRIGRTSGGIIRNAMSGSKVALKPAAPKRTSAPSLRAGKSRK